MHLRNCDATLYFNVKHYLSQKESHFSNFSLYPPYSHNTLHMITRPFINQHYQSPLMNPNALFYDHSSMLKSVPRIIQPTKNGDLSPMHFKILPNESQSSYDTHLFDLPTGLETDITIIFFKEYDLFEEYKGNIRNQ